MFVASSVENGYVQCLGFCCHASYPKVHFLSLRQGHMSNDKECPRYGMAKLPDEQDIAAAAAAAQGQQGNMNSEDAADLYANVRPNATRATTPQRV